MDIKICKNIFILVSSVILTIVFLILSGFTLNHFIHFPIISHEELIKQFRPDIHQWVFEFGPHPKQHFIFLSLLLLAPIFSLFTIFITSYMWRFLSHHFSASNICHQTKYFLSITSLMFFFFLCFSPFKTGFFITVLDPFAPHFYKNHFLINNIIHQLMHQFSYLVVLFILTMLVFALFAFSCIQLIKVCLQSAQKLPEKLLKFGVVISMLIMTVLVIFHGIPGHILTFNLITYYPNLAGDIDATFYGLTQIMHGKTLLANMPSQYGLFSEILYPFFKIMGVSVFKISMLMCVLEIFTLFAFLLALYRLTGSYTLTTLFTFFVCFEGGGIYLFSHFYSINGLNISPYYQYWPIRVFFPAISIIIFKWYLENVSFRKAIIIGAFLGLAMIWNLDSGIPVAGGILLCLCMLCVFSKFQAARSKNIRCILLTIFVAVIVLIVFASYLELKSWFLVNWFDIYKYQRIFYSLGVAQSPMYLDIWIVILMIYLFGIMYSFFKWINDGDCNNVTTASIFYVSILGVGLFSYYEYRANPFNLMSVCWPAILLWFIFSHKVFVWVRQYKLPTISLLFVLPLIWLCLTMAAMYVYSLPCIYKRGMTMLYTTGPSLSSELTKDINFIKSELHGDKQATIMLPGQALFSAELGIVSEIDGPGEMELALKSDYDNGLNQLLSKPVKHVFLKRDDKRLPFLLKKYRVVKISSVGTIHLKSY